MTAYCLWDIREIHDEDAVNHYVEHVTATVEAHGGEYIVIGGPFESIEGEWQPIYPVMIRFPSMEAAKGWYGSDEYASLKIMRLASTSGSAVFMDSAGVAEHFATQAERVEPAPKVSLIG